MSKYNKNTRRQTGQSFFVNTYVYLAEDAPHIGAVLAIVKVVSILQL